MIGDKINAWFIRELPGLTRWIGDMSDIEAIVFAVGLMVFAYLIYAAAYNVWLGAVGGYVDEYEAFDADWMSYQRWRG